MHPQQQIFCLNVKLKFFPEYVPFHNARVLDCGSRDINGTNRFLFHNTEYFGADMYPGPNVDVVCPTHELTYPDNSFGCVICTEVLEHDPHWKDSIANMIRMLKPGGVLIITCAGPERGAHSMHQEGGLTEGEYYGNLDFSGIQECWNNATGNSLKKDIEMGRARKDIYFWGIKPEEGLDDSKRE